MINTQKLYTLIDWFSVTFEQPSVDTYKFISKLTGFLFGLSPEDLEGRPSNKGYEYCLNYHEFFSIHFDGEEKAEKLDRGIHLNITGQGCRFTESINLNHDWATFFEIVKTFNIKNVTRIDLAFDDYKKRLSITKLVEKIESNELVSKLRNYRYMRSGTTLQGESETGETCYIGSPKRIQFRFYDKLQERKAKGHAIDETITTWQRYEIQVRHEQATQLMDTIIEKQDIGTIAKGLFKDYLRFTNKNENDKNRSRWETADFWDAFLGEVENVHLSMIYPESTIAKSMLWIDKATTRTLARLEMYCEEKGEDFTEWVKEWLNTGRNKLKNEDISLVRTQVTLEKQLENEAITFKAYNTAIY